ncbi:cytochrome P450 [Saccharomonospora marina XMU15]|uniref:Cytochrome P450 n=1 Tax=Saccharomonospora marina XMU15 TaxID=882083 RepID=H5WXC6_9PSEU|nr:cytochrome P450 [Saccharomonospora marina]EHR49455.1 cytochrome P450 [Saccharomonospora marina XMU15]
MNRNELRLAFRTLPFLDSHADAPEGFVRLASDPAKLLVWRPDTIDWIFRNDSSLAHPGSRSMRPVLGPRSLLWMDGPRYATYRKVLGPPLGARRLVDYHGIISETTDRAIDRLRQGTVFVLPEWTRSLTLEVASLIVFGSRDEALLRQFSRWIDRALASPYRMLAYRLFRGGLPPSGPKLDALLLRRAREAAATTPPTLASLLLAPDGPLGTIDDDELRDQIVSLLFAGHETTASATAWTIYWIDRNPDIRADVLAELESTSDNGADVKRVPLLHAAVQEALRITPPVPAAGNRVLQRDTRLLGRQLPAGTVLSPSIYLAHRQPDYFAHPHRFDPARFLGSRPQPQRYLPFGGGARHCLGSQLGQLEARMITAALLRRRSLRCVDPTDGMPRSRGHAMAPAQRLRMEVTGCHD